MIALFLLTIAAGAIGWNIRQMVVKKRFSANLEKFHDRLTTCRQLALNSQSDWLCSLTWNGQGWTLQSRSAEGLEFLSPPDLNIGPFLIFLNGKKQSGFSAEFTSTGEIFPKGVLEIRRLANEAPTKWRFPECFLLEEGDRKGPVHPEKDR